MSTELDRRTVMRAGAGAAAASVAAGSTAGSVAAQDQDEIDEYLAETENYDGEIENWTGEEEVELAVGAGDNGLLFEPAAIRVEAGTTVRWEWTGEGGQHNVVEADDDGPLDDPAFESELAQEEGHTYELTFDEPATHFYTCAPHDGVHMRGVVIVQPPNPQPILDEYLAETENYDGTIEDHRGEEEVELAVGAGDNGLLFEPAAVRVDPGTTVQWEWTGEGGQHNVVEADDDGPLDDPAFESELAQEEGQTYDLTFDDPATHRYTCAPHDGVHMRGAVVVGDHGADDDGAGLGISTAAMVILTGIFLIPMLFAIVLLGREMFGAEATPRGQ